MDDYIIKIEKAAVGHVAKAIAEDGTIIEQAQGFGEKDARRQLKSKMQGPKSTSSIPTKRIKEKPSRKIHNPAGVIFSAKNNIERYQAKKAGKKTPRK